MTPDDTALRAFGADVQRLIDGKDLTRERTYELFREMLLGEQPDLQQGALLAALVAKGETPEEIAGAWQAIVEFDTVPAALASVAAGAGPLVENSGTGMDTLKTFNVSSAAAIIAAAGGARLARHGARALTSKCGAVDILEAVGVDVDCEAATVERSIDVAGIGIFNGMSPAVHPGGLGRILSQIRFGSTLNIAASLANPVRPTHAVRGVYSDGMLGPVGDVMMEIGYEHALVVHGYDDRRRPAWTSSPCSARASSASCARTAAGTPTRSSRRTSGCGARRTARSRRSATSAPRPCASSRCSAAAGPRPAATPPASTRPRCFTLPAGPWTWPTGSRRRARRSRPARPSPSWRSGSRPRPAASTSARPARPASALRAEAGLTA